VGALRNVTAAEEVAQDFAYCPVRGDFRQPDPERGRFRDLVRTVLFHLVVNYQRQKQKEARVGSLPKDDADSFGVAADPAGADYEFLARWREELLDRTWEALEREQPKGGAPLYAVLRYRAEHPGTCSEQMAAELAQQLGRPLTAAGVRQLLHRGRAKFAELLLEEVARSLQTSARERVEQELIDLGLYAYCRAILERRRT
jgi:hypothetical protein